jgi:hypothetical protein
LGTKNVDLPDYLMSFLVWHVSNALRNTSVSDKLSVANVPKGVIGAFDKSTLLTLSILSIFNEPRRSFTGNKKPSLGEL